MRAVVLRTHGGPEVLTIESVPDPEPGPEEVLVDIVAAALNRADLLQRMGHYPGPPMAHTRSPASEFSGRVAARGRRAVLWEPGDAVMGISSVAASTPAGSPSTNGGGDGRAGDGRRRRRGRHRGVPHGVGRPRGAGRPPRQGAGRFHAGASAWAPPASRWPRRSAPASRDLLVREGGVCRSSAPTSSSSDRPTTGWVSCARITAQSTWLDVVGGDEVDRSIDALALKGRSSGGMMSGRPISASSWASGPPSIGTVLRPRPLGEIASPSASPPDAAAVRHRRAATGHRQPASRSTPFRRSRPHGEQCQRRQDPARRAGMSLVHSHPLPPSATLHHSTTTTSRRAADGPGVARESSRRPSSTRWRRRAAGSGGAASRPA